MNKECIHTFFGRFWYWICLWDNGQYNRTEPKDDERKLRLFFSSIPCLIIHACIKDYGTSVRWYNVHTSMSRVHRAWNMCECLTVNNCNQSETSAKLSLSESLTRWKEKSHSRCTCFIKGESTDRASLHLQMFVHKTSNSIRIKIQTSDEFIELKYSANWIAKTVFSVYDISSNITNKKSGFSQKLLNYKIFCA